MIDISAAGRVRSFHFNIIWALTRGLILNPLSCSVKVDFFFLLCSQPTGEMSVWLQMFSLAVSVRMHQTSELPQASQRIHTVSWQRELITDLWGQGEWEFIHLQLLISLENIQKNVYMQLHLLYANLNPWYLYNSDVCSLITWLNDW